MRVGVTCPGCGQFCYQRNNGMLSEHKTANYVLGQARGGRRKERCVYSGGTWEDAKAKITPLRRMQMSREPQAGYEVGEI